MNIKELNRFLENVKDKDVGEMTGEELKQIEGLLFSVVERVHLPLLNVRMANIAVQLIMVNIAHYFEIQNENKDCDYCKIRLELKWFKQDEKEGGIFNVDCYFYDIPQIASSFMSFSLAAHKEENADTFFKCLSLDVKLIEEYVNLHDKLHFECTLDGE